MSHIGALTPTLLFRRCLLDRLNQTATAAYALRRLRYAYFGKCCNVRRSSDNATQDIGFSAAGDIDIGSFSAFIGAGNGFVAKWYDQSGNGNDAVQATAANQPQLVLNVTPGGRPAIQYAGAQQLTTTATFVTAPVTYAAVAERTSGTTFAVVADINPVSGEVTLIFAGANQISVFAGTDLAASAADNVLHSLIGICNGASSVISIDGVDSAGNAGPNSGTAVLTIGNGGGATQPLTGYIPELLVFQSTALASSYRSQIRANQKVYWGTP